LYTMFMVLTTENWPDIAESVTEQRPWAAAFFVGYIVVTAFILLNLVIGVIVTALEEEVESQRWKEDQELEQVQHDLVMARLEALSEQVERLSRQVAGLGGEGAGGGDRADGGPATGKRKTPAPGERAKGRESESAAVRGPAHWKPADPSAPG